MSIPTVSSSSRAGRQQSLLRWLGLSGVIFVALLVQSLVSGEALNLPVLLGVTLVGGVVATSLLAVLGRGGDAGRGSNGTSAEHDLLAAAHSLRATRERARAIFAMTTKLSATLEYGKILEEAQNIGILNLHEKIGSSARLVSAVLLFQGADNKLRVITSRGLTPTDQNVAVSGQRGVLGLVLKQAEPVFGADAIEDPELRYFAGFQSAKSVLALPLGAGFDVYGVMIFGCDQPNAFTDDHLELMKAIGTQATVSLQNAVLYQNLAIEKEKIVEVEEDARKKLARDLHDGPTQSVAAIAMRANYIRRLIERQPQQAIEELWKVEDLARRTTKEIRHMLFTLRPLVLENQGLVAALEQLAEKFKETHNTNVEVQAKQDAETYLDTNSQGVLFYIIEEAVNNARKHSQSEKIWVRLFRRDQFVIAEIEDHGIGFDVSEMDAGYDRRGSLGMINMRERAELIEGQLKLQSAKGKGTKISIRVPVDTSGVLDGDAEPAPPLQLQSQRDTRRTAADSQPSRPSRPTRPPQAASETEQPSKRKISHIKRPDSDKLPKQPPPEKKPEPTPAPKPKTGTIKPITGAVKPPTELASPPPQASQANDAPDPNAPPQKPPESRRQRFPSPRPASPSPDEDKG